MTQLNLEVHKSPLKILEFFSLSISLHFPQFVFQYGYAGENSSNDWTE